MEVWFPWLNIRGKTELVAKRIPYQTHPKLTQEKKKKAEKREKTEKKTELKREV